MTERDSPDSPWIQAGRLTVNVNTLNQTASGQLLASDSLTGNGGNWNNSFVNSISNWNNKCWKKQPNYVKCLNAYQMHF